MIKKNEAAIYHDGARLLVETLLMEIRRARLRSPISTEAQAVYAVLCEVSRRMGD